MIYLQPSMGRVYKTIAWWINLSNLEATPQRARSGFRQNFFGAILIKILVRSKVSGITEPRARFIKLLLPTFKQMFLQQFFGKRPGFRDGRNFVQVKRTDEESAYF